MSKTNVVTARIADKPLAELQRLADYYDRSKSWLVAKAVERFVEEESEFFAFLQEGEDAIERGDYITHEELTAEIAVRRKQRRAA